VVQHLESTPCLDFQKKIQVLVLYVAKNYTMIYRFTGNFYRQYSYVVANQARVKTTKLYVVVRCTVKKYNIDIGGVMVRAETLFCGVSIRFQVVRVLTVLVVVSTTMAIMKKQQHTGAPPIL
jgi:hypothetical protein